MTVENQVDLIPENLRTPADTGNLRHYAMMFVVIDGSLQAEECSVDVRFGPERRRVYVRWAVPANGLEWDGRPYVGTDRTCHVQVLRGNGDLEIRENMRCTWFAVSHSVNHEAVARAIFECDPAKG